VHTIKLTEVDTAILRKELNQVFDARLFAADTDEAKRSIMGQTQVTGRARTDDSE
jgi:hypothetical protein